MVIAFGCNAAVFTLVLVGVLALAEAALAGGLGWELGLYIANVALWLRVLRSLRG
jgi:hypothetical protein